LNTQDKKIILAPMEGVLDPLMRNLLTSINTYDLCISEFVRVISALLPEQVYYRMFPELHNGGFTSSGTPIRVQLLGQHPMWMAENALRAIVVGSHGVDINFGCPAKAVNKSRGGAVLLKDPEQIFKIVSAVREALGADNILSVKIRLGFDDASLLDEIVDSVVSANANMLTVHARTKADGYRPPAYWHFIGQLCDKYNQDKYQIDIVANGEIWGKDTALDCIAQAKTSNLMVGRGALALPNLANVIKNDEQPMPWSELTKLIQHYSQVELLGDKSFYFSSRLKQWLRYLKLQYPQADLLFQQIKTMKSKEDILNIVKHLS
jgi:tRNA-dihydrouridine synthase C